MKNILKNKKILIIIVPFALLLLVFLIVIMGAPVTEEGNIEEGGFVSDESTVTNPDIPDSPLPPVAQVPKDVSKKITAEGEKMPQSNDYIVDESPDYSIIYFDEDKAFLITILTSPFDEKRDLAEKAFLETLNISEDDACDLTVYITTIMRVNPNEGGRNHFLSFCSN